MTLVLRLLLAKPARFLANPIGNLVILCPPKERKRAPWRCLVSLEIASLLLFLPRNRPSAASLRCVGIRKAPSGDNCWALSVTRQFRPGWSRLPCPSMVQGRVPRKWCRRLPCASSHRGAVRGSPLSWCCAPAWTAAWGAAFQRYPERQ